MRRYLLLLALTVAAVPAAHALIIAGTDGTTNTTAPANGAPWDHVGTIGGTSGVYLGAFGGGYWVITADHVGLGNITLNNVTYTAVSGSGLQLAGADVFVYRISSDPGLSNLALSAIAPLAGANVTLIGFGADRGLSPLTGQSLAGWTVTGPSNNLVWTEIASGTADALGYFESGSHTMRWGTNTITGTSSYNIGTGATSALYTTFNAVTGEAQGANGDSGGAMFYLNGSTWELAGILGAVGTFNNQPGSTAIFGNVTYAADLSAYRGTILSAIPEPADFAVWSGALVAGVALWRRRRSV